MSDLITQLKQDPFQFGLFQAASLLERIALGQGDTASWGPSDHPGFLLEIFSPYGRKIPSPIRYTPL